MDFILQYISEELIYALGWTVVHSIWQGLLIAIIMALLMQSMQKSSAKLRYEVASISLFLVFVFSLSTFILLYDGINQKEFGEITLIGHASSENAALSGSFFQNTVQACIDYFNTHLSVIVAIWLIGVTFFFIRLIGGLVYVQRLKYEHNGPLPAYWQKKLSALSEKIPLRKSIELLESSMVKVPMVIGYFKPVILMPVGAVNGLSESEVEAILAHELGHIFRNDFLMNIVLSFVEVLFYYHPAVWFISANVRLERENCSDDIAIKLCGNSLTYAKALVTLQEMNHHPVPSFAMTFSGRKNQLLNRIKRILNQPQNRSNIIEKLTATCLLLVAIFILSIGANTPFDGISEKIEKAKEHHKLHFYSEQIDENVLVDIIMINDTVPDNRRKETYRIIKKENGETTEFTMEDGEIVELKINGESIPKEEFENYEDLVDEMISDIPEPPVPPIPPTPSVAPVAPTPPVPPVAPTPPNPSKAPFFQVKKRTTQTVTKGKNDSGQTTIVIETDDGKEPMEIVIEKEGNLILIEGNELKEGDTAIIIDEHDPGFGYRNFIPKELKFDEDKLLDWVESGKGGNIWAFEDGHGTNLFRFDKEHMEKNKEDQQKAIELYQEQLFAYRKDLNHQSAELQKLTRKQMKELSDQLRDSQRLMKEYNIFYFGEGEDKVQEYLFDTKDLKDNFEIYFEGNGRFNSQNSSSRIERELVEDGLIKNGSDYKLELNDKRMKVNGEKQPDEVLEKYKNLYERSTNSKMDKNANLSINKKDD